ncbi:MAG: hypothetical protein AB1Z29_26740, partial [Desulfobacterales bacterium]
KLTLYFFIFAIAAMMLSVSVSSVSAEEKPVANSGWEFQVAPYMWFLSLNGNVERYWIIVMVLTFSKRDTD